MFTILIISNGTSTLTWLKINKKSPNCLTRFILPKLFTVGYWLTVVSQISILKLSKKVMLLVLSGDQNILDLTKMANSFWKI
ncbi:hypothetical protein D3C72_1073040 [compost metagenome]